MDYEQMWNDLGWEINRRRAAKIIFGEDEESATYDKVLEMMDELEGEGE